MSGRPTVSPARETVPNLLLAANAATLAAACAATVWYAVVVSYLFWPAVPVGIVVAIVIFFFAMPIAALHAFVLGLPLYLLTRRWGSTWWSAGCWGVAIGGAPWILYSLWADRHVDFDHTLGLPFAVCGAAGGIGFWWQLHRAAEDAL